MCVRLFVLSVSVNCQAELVPGALGGVLSGSGSGTGLGSEDIVVKATIKASALACFTLTFPGLPPFSIAVNGLTSCCLNRYRLTTSANFLH